MKARIKRLVLLVVIILEGVSCSIESELLAPDTEYEMVIRSGTSYGMCVGYCVRSLDISGANATYYMVGYQTDDYPMKTKPGKISIEEWNNLIIEIDEKQIKRMNNVYGCPDCADGGAEWVEIVTKSYSKKITFEIYDVPGEISELVDKLRLIRKRFNPDNI